MTTIRKRSVVFPGKKKTSVSVEDVIWDEFKKDIALRGSTVAQSVMDIKSTMRPTNLSSAIRVYVVIRLRQQLEEATCESNREESKVA